MIAGGKTLVGAYVIARGKEGKERPALGPTWTMRGRVAAVEGSVRESIQSRNERVDLLPLSEPVFEESPEPGGDALARSGRINRLKDPKARLAHPSRKRNFSGDPRPRPPRPGERPRQISAGTDPAPARPDGNEMSHFSANL